MFLKLFEKLNKQLGGSEKEEEENDIIEEYGRVKNMER